MPYELFILILIAVNGVATWRGINDPGFLERFEFRIDRILPGRDYKRLITSSFLHVGWWHLAFNMLALYSFGKTVMAIYSPAYFILIYFASVVGGNLLALFFHRNHSDYRAVGASGGVSGVVFAYVLIFPDMELSFFFVEMKAWYFAVAYLFVSIYGVKSQFGNIGHSAHLGGTITGILLAIIRYPSVLRDHTWLVALLLIPTALFLWLSVKRPEFLLIDNYFKYRFKRHRNRRREAAVRPEISSPREKRKADPRLTTKKGRPRKPIMTDEERLNLLLDKMNEHGYDSLTDSEKLQLRDLSGKL